MSKHVLNTRLPRRIAREIVNAFGRMQFSCDRALRQLYRRPRLAIAEPWMSGSPSSPAVPLARPAGGDAASVSEGDDRKRMHQLYREHSPSLVRQLTRRTGCRELARELANETFLRLLRMPAGKIRRVEQPEAFLRQVSINLLRDRRRATALRHRSQPTLEIVSDHQLDQVAALEARDTLRRLEHALSKLNPKTREIFLAHRIDGFTYTEIASRTGLSVKGVEKQMSKAIAKIDRVLDRG